MSSGLGARTLEATVVQGRVAIIHNAPQAGRYSELGEQDAVLGVLETVELVNATLVDLGYGTQVLALEPPLSRTASAMRALDANVAFNLFEGWEGLPESEADVTRLLEETGACLTGCPSESLRLCANKVLMKQTLGASGIPTPACQLLAPDCLDEFALAFPCVVKPLGEHASHGLSPDSFVSTGSGLARQVDWVWQTYGRAAVVEEFLPGRELCAFVVGNEHPRVLPIEEAVYELAPGRPRLLTYASKWIPGDEYFVGTKVQCPAELDPGLQDQAEWLAVQAFHATGCMGYARMDLRQDDRGRLRVLDVNPNPDISSSGGARMQLDVAGIPYADFIEEVLSLARQR